MVPARLGELLIAIALVAAGVLFVWQSAVLPFGEVGLPGPGFFPFVLGILLSVFALTIVVRTVRQRREDPVVYLGHRDILVVFAALVGVGFAFERLGAYATLGLFTAALLLLVARTSLWRGVLGATLGMVAVWVFFKVLLGVQLPAGPF
jgi:Na+-transporting NADH:ubiquinone oxidoreductase subunit NqrB